ncbi:cell division septation protein DedD [Granulicella aggregans]|uniref:Cell division septation protein DedD n=1 Tax=Granulicella aggregans TaxID=474949 RepID=A0A7W7ZB27_9BACT|nr:SPOR domain-containing protein [Granulicella aggregans]MBB5056081.1 cell division septation protein DedD [Granulicella aggregans]
MATLHDRDRDVSDYREHDRTRIDQEDREISLGTGTILGIFFGLALLCAIFFGFGYSMGRKSVQTAITAATPQPSTSTGGVFSSFKPSAGSSGSPVHAATTQPQDAKPNTPSDPDGEIVTAPVTSSTEPPVKPAARPVALKAPAEAPATAPVAMPTATSSGTTMVQIAAVSHQEDADTLIAALKKKGYTVFIRNEPQDHLLHVQVGPFATRKDADAMRQHLLADGYNAIVK